MEPPILKPEEAERSHESEKRVRQLLALNKAAIAITSELELDRLLQRIVDAARELVGCKYAALGVLGEDGYIELFPTSGISEIDREKIGAPPRGHGLLGVMIRAGRSLRIADMSTDPRRVGFPPHHPIMTSVLGVPIFVQGKLVGDLYLTDKIGGPEFTEEDEWLIQLLATHTGTALTNAQLHADNVQALQRADQGRARSQALLKVTQAINGSIHLDEVIHSIIKAALDLLRASGAAVYILEPSDQGDRAATHQFGARYAIGLEESLTTGASQLPMEASMAGRSVVTRMTQIIPDTSKEPDIVFPRLAGKTLRSLVAVPLVANGRVLGALSTYSDRVDAFDSDAVELLEAFGAIASTAIYNTGLYEEAERGREAAEREQQRLRELEQMKDEFLSTAAHELRTPLTTIRMSAGLALDQMKRLVALDELDPRLLDLISLVSEGSERMQSLVNDLLDLTRLEQGRTVLSMENLDLREVLRASVEATSPLFASKGQTLSVRMPETPCPVRGDMQRLEQIVINLLSNAHKYSQSNSRVEVGTKLSDSGEERLVWVRDNGPGVPEEEREQIFERFYRSSLHRNDRTVSTGLGLPIARAIAEMHKGKLWVEPARGGGSVFTLALPARA